MKQEGLLERLRKYTASEAYPFHMPGHKRNPESGQLAELYQYDITEIDGFDNLHQPESIIKAAEQRAAELYHSKETHFLVNGSTGGILSAVSAVAETGKKLIISRNCHKAVYHAAFLNRLELHYVYPDILKDYDMAGPIMAGDVEREIRGILSGEKETGKNSKERIAGVVITSPTYDGIVSNVKEIATVVHSYGIPLIVDQAHGAHFGMHPLYPENAVTEGADIVIHSVHKTLPAPTQTALIHRNGDLIKEEVLRKYLRIYQSSSPSYILMMGIDEAVRLAEKEGYKRLDRLLYLRNHIIKETEDCEHIKICPFTEPGKLAISIWDYSMTGQILYDVLREKYHLQMEMASGNYVIAIITMMDTEEGMLRLSSALQEIDREISSEQKRAEYQPENIKGFIGVHRNIIRSELWEAYIAPWQEKDLDQAAEETAAEFICLYPPGIPLLVPGEIVDTQLIKMIYICLKEGYNIQGISQNKIKIVRHD